MASLAYSTQHYHGWSRFSSEKQTDSMQPLPVLADDFETWMETWTWKWTPERKQEVDLILATKFPTGQIVARNIANSGFPTTPGCIASRLSRREEYLGWVSLPPRSTVSSSTCSEPRTPLVVAHCTEFFEVKNSPNKGYGAFAIKDIEIGTVVISETPLFRCYFSDVFHKFEEVTREQRAEYHTLHGHMTLAPDNKILAIYKTNRFETTDSKGGIFLKSSRFNHACHPHATCRYYYDATQNVLVVTACQNIKKGQEITISYTINPSQLPDNYGFSCDCPGCQLPYSTEKSEQMIMVSKDDREFEYFTAPTVVS